jgi:tRNA/tmRNA/rRNA uracil-C5-methylase (TrmA/RlmC/RlmD family)
MAMQVGKEIELEINDVAFGGRGVGRHDGCVVFVAGVLGGERARVRITKARKRYAEGELLEVLKDSEQRCEPVCKYVGLCPGCCYQHVEYAEEVRIKQRQLEDLLKRIGGLEDIEFRPPVGAPENLGYRNKLVLHAQRERKLGYFGADNRTVVDIDECKLAVGPINEKLRALRSNIKYMKNLPPRARVTLRWTESDGVVYWVDRNSGVERLVEKSPFGDMRVPRRSFYQVNPLAGALLLERVSDIIKESSPEYFVDLFCGVGLFAIAAAQAGVKHVLGVERQSMAVRAARQNARDNGVRAEFIAADAEDIASDAFSKIDCTETTVIVDPPRDGLEKVLVEALIESRPREIIYVSCAPDTLARDLKMLVNGGYEVLDSQLIDMFPRTMHFESVTRLRFSGL